MYLTKDVRKADFLWEYNGEYLSSREHARRLPYYEVIYKYFEQIDFENLQLYKFETSEQSNKF